MRFEPNRSRTVTPFALFPLRAQLIDPFRHRVCDTMTLSPTHTAYTGDGCFGACLRQHCIRHDGRCETEPFYASVARGATATGTHANDCWLLYANKQRRPLSRSSSFLAIFPSCHLAILEPKSTEILTEEIFKAAGAAVVVAVDGGRRFRLGGALVLHQRDRYVKRGGLVGAAFHTAKRERQ